MERTVDARQGGGQAEADLRQLAFALIKWHDRVEKELRARSAYDDFQARLAGWHNSHRGGKPDEVRAKGLELQAIVMEFNLGGVLQQQGPAVAVRSAGAVRTRGAIRVASGGTTAGPSADLFAQVAASYHIT